MPQECRSCHEPVYWAQHHTDPTKSPLPFDWHSADGDSGGHAVWRDGQGVPRYRALKKGEQPGPGEHRMVCHWGTCRDAAQWRSRAGPAKTTTQLGHTDGTTAPNTPPTRPHRTRRQLPPPRHYPRTRPRWHMAANIHHHRAARLDGHRGPRRTRRNRHDRGLPGER